MGILDMLLGRKPAAAKTRHSRPPNTQIDSQQTQGGASAQSVRKDLLKLVMRETLTRNGIPPTWIAAEMLRTSNAKKEPGLHVRFQLRHWDARLLAHGVAFEHEFTQRLLLLDPLARSWLMGFSWQFALEDESACPPLPQASLWTTPDPSVPAALATQPAPIGGADVIQGPSFDPRPLDDVRADLERLLALRDEDMRQHGGATEHAYAPTRPATL